MRILAQLAGVQAAALLIATSAALAAQGSTEAGFVLSVRGEWFSASHPAAPLGPGQVLVNDDQVWAGARSVGQALSVALYADPSRLELRCDDPGVCDRRHPIRASRGGRGYLRELLSVVAGLIGGESERYVPLITRGERPLREAVLGTSPGGVDLAPVLDSIGAGSMWLKATALDSAATAGRWRWLRVTWRPGAPALVPADRLPPGLYAVELEDKPDTEAWLLVENGPATDDAARFGEVAAAVEGWGTSGRADARTVLRAVLHSLTLRGSL